MEEEKSPSSKTKKRITFSPRLVYRSPERPEDDRKSPSSGKVKPLSPPILKVSARKISTPEKKVKNPEQKMDKGVPKRETTRTASPRGETTRTASPKRETTRTASPKGETTRTASPKRETNMAKTATIKERTVSGGKDLQRTPTPHPKKPSADSEKITPEEAKKMTELLESIVIDIIEGRFENVSIEDLEFVLKTLKEWPSGPRRNKRELLLLTIEVLQKKGVLPEEKKIEAVEKVSKKKIKRAVSKEEDKETKRIKQILLVGAVSSAGSTVGAGIGTGLIKGAAMTFSLPYAVPVAASLAAAAVVGISLSYLKDYFWSSEETEEEEEE